MKSIGIITFWALIFTPARAQLDPLDGMLVTSYTTTGTLAAPAAPGTLTLNHTDNPSFDGTLVLGESTGDAAVGSTWGLEVVGADYERFTPGLGNLAGVQITPVSGSVQTGDTLEISMGVTFNLPQLFQEVNPDLGLLLNMTPTTATLTPAGGSAVDLLNTPANTPFGTGDYTLFMQGVTNTDSPDGSALAASFAAVPEPSAFLLALLGLLLLRNRFRRGR